MITAGKPIAGLKRCMAGGGRVYQNWKTGEEVSDDDAYRYALNAVKEDPRLMEEFRSATVEWFFSGGQWRKTKEENT